jgi:glycosyltransferase involved in cell wall biosynthesis
MKILILYTELAGYTVACLEELLRSYPVELRLVRWPVNQEAPFDFAFDPGVTVLDRQHLTQHELNEEVRRYAPDGIFCSGWLDRGYLKALAHKPAGCPVICGLDNQWNGHWRQQVARWLSPWLVRRYFDYIWGAGPRQATFARQLGYDEAHIRQGYYSADVPRFSQVQAQPGQDQPPTLLYVGRIMAHKGIPDLLAAFLSLAEQTDWHLQLIGKPDGSVGWPAHPRITQWDFVQPAELPASMARASAFVLPSREEPWGVALHEAAAVGLPLIASDACGAGDAFVEAGKNGQLFAAGDASSLTQALTQLFDLPSATRAAWGAHSRQLAQRITPQTWAQTLVGMIESS